MLNVLIIISFVCWIVTFFINKFTLYTVMLIVPTVMFCLRKVGIHLKYSTIITAEVLLIFFSIVWRCLFHNFHGLNTALILLDRIVFIIVCIYDDTTYVYVNEERKKL